MGRASASIADTLKRWQREGEEIENGLRKRRQELVAELAIIDQSLATFQARRAARGEPAAAPARTVKVKTGATGAGTAEAVVDATATELLELKPFWFVLKDQTRKIVEARAKGIAPADIAKNYGTTNGAINNRVFAARARLRAARQAGEKPEEGAGGEKEEPDGAAVHEFPEKPEAHDGVEAPGPAASQSAESGAVGEEGPAESPPALDARGGEVSDERPLAGWERGRAPAAVSVNQVPVCQPDGDLSATPPSPLVLVDGRLVARAAAILPVLPPSVGLEKEEVTPIIPAPVTDGERQEARNIIPKVIPAAPPSRRAAQLSPAASNNSPVARFRRASGRSPVAPRATVPEADQVDDDALEGFDTPLVRIRRRVHSAKDGRIRSKTIAPGRLRRDEIKLGELLVHPAGVERPLTRADCENDPGRPCPWVSCSHHLYLEVNPQTGAIKLNFPHLEVWEMAETCSLDVADRGGITLEEVGAIMNLTRERIRQVETRGLTKIKDHTGNELGLPPERSSGGLAGAVG